ncbi:HAMP domain-containing protein [Bacillus aquiflavi]|uniref:PAS domain-containing sensor histidine kinase n=1 Tax=Bacillus aquiflavi TaxID=2672567 RepID=UPI001CA8A3BC|nr:PAS domain-containing sensor histidine kinase [Bacillus aquiflavi]UAC48769.1 HAMP domain-containing protein [Bacillus aquiflavi]
MKRIINWLLSHPIRNKVLVFGVMMSTIPLLSMSLYYYFYVKADLEERILDKQELMLKNLSNEIELEFNQTLQQIQLLSSINDSNSENGSFYELLHKNTSIEEIVMTNEGGIVEKRVSRFKLNLALENEKWFTDEMWYDLQTNDQVYGEVEFNELGQPVMKAAVPYIEAGERKGIGVIVQLQKIIGKISSARHDDSSYIYLIDQNDRVIAHQDYSKLWQIQTVPKSKDVLGVKTRIDDLNWTLVMEQPTATAFRPINELFQNGLIVVIFITLIVSLISVYAGLYFTTPIVLIERAMKRLKIGYRTKPINILRTDELGKLAVSFNEMSEELQEKSFRLEQEKERLNVVVNGIGAGLALVTKDYEVTWMNPILKEWLNRKELSLPCYSLIGGKRTPCQECPITCPDLQNHQADRFMKFTIKSGEEKVFHHRVFSLNHTIEAEGEFLLVIEDVTEQKEMEEKIIQTDRLSALGLMASSFAHEVNNPLTTINVYAEDLTDRLELEDLERDEIQFYLKKINENTERCKKITRNLLNFSRKSNWTVTRIDIYETIENSINLVDYLFKKHQIQLQLEIEPNLPPILGDSLNLMQVLVNLLHNGIDAIEEEGTMTIAACKDREYVVLTVKDSGVGIRKEELSKLFDPFYTTKPVGKGTGLGLSVCYGIIQQFGGEIQMNSQVGVGTTVEVRLPIAPRIEEENDADNKAFSRR